MSTLKKIAAVFPGKRVLERMAALECKFTRWWVASAHKRLMQIQWGMSPQPEHFDHHIDLFHQWLDRRSSFWLERGIFGGVALKGGDVLELACGDGFNARNFYSARSRRVVACDFDPSAISTARLKNAAPNLEFHLADIRTDMPQGIFDNVIWDAAIEHFTPKEISGILANIKRRLAPNGVLTGYTLVERADGQKSLTHHEYEFKGKDDLLNVLRPSFAHVLVFETKHPTRHNLYFYASDGAIPFSQGWTSMAVSEPTNK